eukprot:TRINITY_DN2536_c0_g1_i2.p2 TRINITY_DN2536_c0_g1~~TRINITY_DN2536_c0_g1_i2.p2  ORF type:complete len:318 (+),score=47.61 TRINITY_DN2536_c0_g1_i2:988-1941(+)
MPGDVALSCHVTTDVSSCFFFPSFSPLPSLTNYSKFGFFICANNDVAEVHKTFELLPSGHLCLDAWGRGSVLSRDGRRLGFATPGAVVTPLKLEFRFLDWKMEVSHKNVPQLIDTSSLYVIPVDQPNVSLRTLTETEPSYRTVATRFMSTMPPTTNIVSIQEVVNHRLRLQCDVSLKLLKAKHALSGDDIVWVRDLFHGTGRNPPSVIYTSEMGFMQQLARDGFYGFGTYFAENASYSNQFAHRTEYGTRQMFLCHVITAKHHVSNSRQPQTRAAPLLPGSTNERYDSVQGLAGSDTIWIVYENTRAYPAWLITYRF